MANLTDPEVFWLARYAHNKLAPLFKEAKAIEPSLRFSIELRFHNPNKEFAEGRVAVFGHWDRTTTPAMFLYSTRNETKADIDQLAVQVKADIDRLKLEALIKVG
jgi:hypothetical protein